MTESHTFYHVTAHDYADMTIDAGLYADIDIAQSVAKRITTGSAGGTVRVQPMTVVHTAPDRFIFRGHASGTLDELPTDAAWRVESMQSDAFAKERYVRDVWSQYNVVEDYVTIIAASFAEAKRRYIELQAVGPEVRTRL